MNRKIFLLALCATHHVMGSQDLVSFARNYPILTTGVLAGAVLAACQAHDHLRIIETRRAPFREIIDYILKSEKELKDFKVVLPWCRVRQKRTILWLVGAEDSHHFWLIDREEDKNCTIFLIFTLFPSLNYDEEKALITSLNKYLSADTKGDGEKISALRAVRNFLSLPDTPTYIETEELNGSLSALASCTIL